MPKLPQARSGERLETLGRPTPFSFWPTRRLRAHAKAQSILFSLDPWLLLKEVLKARCNPDRLAEALACLDQSRDFFVAGTEKGIEAARPLALYYSYMNIAKTLCLMRGHVQSFDRAQHGLWEPPRQAGNVGIDQSELEIFPSPNSGRRQVFDELRQTLTGPVIGTQQSLRLKNVLPQILPGHRLWAQATDQQERFIAFHDIQFWRNKQKQQVWLRLYLIAADLSRLRITHKKFLDRSGLQNDFNEVDCDERTDGKALICFEQTEPIHYPDRHPADVLDQAVTMVRPKLWATVASVTPYRRFYAYLCPPNENASLLPQVLSIYALTYYLGSITRYRPHDFEALLSGKYGPRIHDFVTGQPLQFLYLIASEIARQDITRPAIL